MEKWKGTEGGRRVVRWSQPLKDKKERGSKLRKLY